MVSTRVLTLTSVQTSQDTLVTTTDYPGLTGSRAPRASTTNSSPTWATQLTVSARVLTLTSVRPSLDTVVTILPKPNEGT